MNSKMPTQLENVTQRLREMILGGYFQSGKKIGEMALAKQLGVSRTPIRLALQILEKEGLLKSAPRRGFTVREFTIDEVIDAIDVRGQLESMAARLAAERGIDSGLAERLERCLEEAAAIVEAASMTDEDRARWVESNRCFHATLVEAAGNAVLADTLDHVGRIPLAPPSAIIFHTDDPVATRSQMAAALADHRAVYDAVVQRQGSRAEALMREHAYLSRETKRRNIGKMKQNRSLSRLPGLDLVSAG